MIGVIADDTTAANDIGIMFSKNQYSVKILPHTISLETENDSDVLILDTNSRLDSPKVSYEKVYSSTKKLKDQGCSLYFNKTCSVFRGNIGKEFDAMLDALNEDFAVIVLSFPKNGRQTLQGIHTVHGKRLEESEFAKDPVHPMFDSNLVSILQKQTDRKVSMVDIGTVRQGSERLREVLKEQRKKANYCIIDAETQQDLTLIARAIVNYPVLCGSSAIAEELPKFLPLNPTTHPADTIDIADDNGVLVVSGSLTPQTKAQTAYLSSSGMEPLILNTRVIFNPSKKEQEVNSIINRAQRLIKDGQDLLILADNSEECVKETKETGSKLGMDDLAISKLVSASLAEITKKVVGHTGLKRLIIAGGDTSGTICSKLGIRGNYVLKEIETGLPSGLAIGKEMLIVLKSGSFGGQDFLSKAIHHLKDI